MSYPIPGIGLTLRWKTHEPYRMSLVDTSSFLPIEWVGIAAAGRFAGSFMNHEAEVSDLVNYSK